MNYSTLQGAVSDGSTVYTPVEIVEHCQLKHYLCPDVGGKRSIMSKPGESTLDVYKSQSLETPSMCSRTTSSWVYVSRRLIRFANVVVHTRSTHPFTSVILFVVRS